MGKITQEKRDQIQALLLTGFKNCGSCKQDLPLGSFWKNCRTITGYGSNCKPCHMTLFHAPKLKEINARTKAWMKANPEKAREMYRKKNAKPHIRIKRSFSKRLKRYLGSTAARPHFREAVSCSAQELITHLESQFTPEMS